MLLKGLEICKIALLKCNFIFILKIFTRETDNYFYNIYMILFLLICLFDIRIKGWRSNIWNFEKDSLDLLFPHNLKFQIGNWFSVNKILRIYKYLIH